MLKAEAHMAYWMFRGPRPCQLTLSIIERDGKSAPLGDIRRFAVENRQHAREIAESHGIEIISWQE